MIYDGYAEASIKLAKEAILSGELVAFPTETVYGLGADAFNESAVQKIFKVKNRPANHPLIVHISSVDQLTQVVEGFNSQEEVLAKSFWPGPLTIVTSKSKKVSDSVTGGLKTVGVRMPNHPIALKLISECGRPIAAPSSNKFQSISPTDAQAVFDELGTNIGIILDGGPCEVGLESTVVRIINGVCEILRPGGISKEDIKNKTNLHVAFGESKSPNVMLSPGMSDFHYAPKKKFKAILVDDVKQFIKAFKNSESRLAVLCFSKAHFEILKKFNFKEIVLLSDGGDLSEAAQKLYFQMRRLDSLDIDGILAIRPSSSEIGYAINDRLTKAEHGF